MSKPQGFSMKPTHAYIKPQEDQDEPQEEQEESLDNSNLSTGNKVPVQARKPSVNTISDVRAGSARGLAVRSTPVPEDHY